MNERLITLSSDIINCQTGLNKITDKVIKFDNEVNNKKTKRVNKELYQSNLIPLSLIIILVYEHEEEMEDLIQESKQRKRNDGKKVEKKLTKKATK